MRDPPREEEVAGSRAQQREEIPATRGSQTARSAETPVAPSKRVGGLFRARK
jgi:hypothetical protein